MSGKPLVGTGGSEGGDAFAEAHRALLADRSIQFELEPEEAPAIRPPSSFTMPDLTVAFWLLLAAIVLFLLYAIASRLDGIGWRRRSRTDVDEVVEPGWRPAESEARGLLARADELAAQGDYGEAAHLLLFRSIEEIEARRPETVRPALTSRDIAALPAIPPQPRRAFARIAMAVERALFARRPLGPAEWSDCRSAYEAFAFAEGWG